MPDSVPLSPVPPPTAEITVRTMSSDIASVRSSGGTALTSPGAQVPLAAHAMVAGTSHVVSSLVGWLAVLLALVAVAAGGWYGYGYLTQQLANTTTQPVPTSTTPTGSSAGTTSPNTIAAHTSQLARPAAYTGTFPIVAPAGTLKTHFQLIKEGLNQVPASARTAELTPTNAEGRPLSFPGYTTAIGAPNLLNQNAYTDLQDDFTLLAVRGQGGFSVAYILTLKEGASWLYAAPGIRQIEDAPRLGSLFLQLAGKRSGDFIDGTIASQPVRIATYEEPAGTLVYGFFGDNLVIATSQQALDEALLLL